MIDRKELRIGNLVVLAHESNAPIAEIEEIRSNAVMVNISGEAGARYFTFEGLMPIELNPDWLDKIGFIKRPDKVNIWQLGRLSLWLENGMLCYLTHEDHDNDNYYIPNGGIAYVHELMNLYYWLYKKELTIKSFNQSN